MKLFSSLKSKKLIVSGILFFNAVICAASITMAWFIDKTYSLIGGEASVNRSYFEGGDGSAATPYLIKYPIQFYYFTWLQDMGYFNIQDDDNPGSYRQYHFELIDNLDMKDYILPPAGSDKYPFIGSFDGKGYKIENLTITNAASSYTDEPENLNNDERNYQIMGVFGVVGRYGNLQYTYNSSANYIQNIVLENVTVNSSVPKNNQTLVGIAAGYLNASATNIYVDDSNIKVGANIQALSSITTNKSDYSLVGFVGENSSSQIIKESIQSRYVADPSFNEREFDYSELKGTAWGGSIDMKTMYTRLKTINARENNYLTVHSNVLHTYLDNGAPTTQTSGEQTTPYFKQEYYVNSGMESPYASVVFNRYSTGNFAAGQPNAATNDFLYLFGKNDNAEFGSSGTTVAEQTHFYISATVNGTRHFLRITGTNNNSFGDTTNIAEATKFLVDSANNTGHVYGLYGNTPVYLRYNNRLVVTTNQNNTNTTLNIVDDVIRYTNNNISYCIAYNNGWSFVQQTLQGYYITNADKTHFLSVANNGSITDQTSKANASVWTVDTGNRRVSTTVGNTTYYLYRRTNSTTGLGVTTTTTNLSSVTFSNSNTTLTITTNNNGNRYVRYNNGWGLINSNTSVTAEGHYSYIEQSGFKTDFSGNVLSNVYKNSPGTYSTKGTFFPLISDDNLVPEDNNTGYVISGSEFLHDTDKVYPLRSGDIRVSRYELSNISRGWTNNNYGTIYTYNGSYTNITNSTNYVKFEAAKKNFKDNTLTGSSNVFGLHFMNATISKDKYVLANVKLYDINSPTGVSEYDNYKLPEDCIDFHLQEKGYINFFAGAYFSNNNSFFSLHKIERNSSNPREISSITHIKEVWEHKTDKAADYVYVYDTNPVTYSTSITSNQLTANYNKKFDYTWIENPGNTLYTNTTYRNSLFYFEIPVNSGEYALGSVDGKAGAYLLYLDISAGAVKVRRSQTVETFKFVNGQYDCLTGICFVNTAVADLSDKTRATIKIANGTTAIDINYDLDENHHLILSDVSKATGTYIDVGYELTDSSMNVIDIADNSTPVSSQIILRKTNRDYDKVTDVVTTTMEYITVTTDAQGNSTRTAVVYDETMTDVSTKYPIRGLDEDGQEITPTFDTTKQIFKYHYDNTSTPNNAIVNVNYRFEISGINYSNYNDFVVSSYNYKCIITIQSSVEIKIYFDDLDPNYTYVVNGTTISANTKSITVSATGGLVAQEIFPITEDTYDDNEGDGDGIWRVI